MVAEKTEREIESAVDMFFYFYFLAYGETQLNNAMLPYEAQFK